MIRSNRNPYLPPWLQDVPLPPKPPTPEQEDTGDAPLFSGLPEWLRDEDETDQATAPSWLRPAPDTLEEEASMLARTPGSEPAPIAPFAPSAPSEASPPSWLQSLRDSIVIPDTPESDETASESAPWTSTEASDIGLPSGLSTGSGEMEAPPWLANERPEQHADAPPDRDVEAHTGRDRPSWSGDAGEEPNEVDLPAWLRELPVADDTSQTPLPASKARSENLPDWLRDIAAAPPEPPSAPPPAAPAPTGDLPDWLRDVAAAPPEPPSAPVTPAGGAAPPAGDLPDWLQTPASSSQETPPWLEDEHGRTIPSGDAGLPDWLRGIDITPPDARDGQPQTMDSPAQISSDLLSGMDLPEWLRVESEPKPETAPVSARDLDWLKRLGGIVEDEAGVGTAVAAPKLPPPPAPQRTEEQMQALNLLRHLAAEPIPSAAPLPAPERESALQRIGLDRLLSITLLVLVLIAVVFSGVAPSLEAPPLVPAVSDTHDQIAALGANDVVLVGYEWDARRVGELRPLERAVIGHLIAQNVKLILVSTDPQGTLLQFDLLDTLRNAGYRQQGEGYLLLGYKPGGEIALRTLARDFQAVLRSDYRGDDATGSALIAGIDTGRPIARLNDLSLIIVLADDTPDVQGWMEQVYPQAQTGGQPTPMVFLLPEEAAPVVQPYMRQPGVAAIAGQRGALAYTSISQGSGAPGVAEAVTHQRLVILLFVVVLVSGLAISGINAARRRRP